MARKKLTIDKYNYGSYVVINQQRGEPATPKTNVGGSAMSGLASGASIGTSILPGWGTAIGAVVGGIGGLISGNSKNKRRQREQKKLDLQSLNSFTQQYDANIDSVNENPYGTYQDGGDVAPNLTPINIELGEILVDPQTGKIKREFSGINPETGGLYEPHAKGRKKDTPNNIVTAEEGSFVITKQKAKEYKDAIKNNDKLAQNSIMHNIRNKKRQSMKFAEGGLVDPPINLFPTVDWQQIEKLKRPTQTGTNQLSGIISNNNSITESSRFNPNKITYGDPNRSVSSLTNKTANAQAGFNWGDLMTALPAVSNLIQGFSSPNYMKSGPSYVNPYRNQILANMPRDINYSPLFNRIYRDRNTAYGLIDETTNSSAIARANKLNVMANTQRGIQDTYFQGEDYNNRIRGQRAGIYGNLAAQELDQFYNDRQFNYGIGMLNRQMQEGRRQQINYGLSQLGQLYQNKQLNSRLENRDRDLMNLLPQIFPALEYYLDNYKSGGNNG